MAFSTGTAASWTALTAAMNAFLTAGTGANTLPAFTTTYLDGVSEQSGAVFDAATWELDGMYWNFDYAPTDKGGSVRCWMSTGTNDKTLNHYGQKPGNPKNGSATDDGNSTQMNFITFPLDYFFFGDNSSGGTHDTFHMVVKPSAGRYHHFWIGYIDPYWAAARPFGAFSAASQLTSSSLRTPMSGDANQSFGFNLLYYPYSAAPVGPQTDIQNGFSGTQAKLQPNWMAASGLIESQSAASNSRNALEPFIRAGQQNLTGRSILSPNPATISNASTFDIATGFNIVVIGEYANANMLSLEGLNVEDLITIGSDTYQVFPTYSRGSDSDPGPFFVNVSGVNDDSGILGFAYKRFT